MKVEKLNSRLNEPTVSSRRIGDNIPNIIGTHFTRNMSYAKLFVPPLCETLKMESSMRNATKNLNWLDPAASVPPFRKKLQRTLDTFIHKDL
jgi:hypothetical protein